MKNRYHVLLRSLKTLGSYEQACCLSSQTRKLDKFSNLAGVFTNLFHDFFPQIFSQFEQLKKKTKFFWVKYTQLNVCEKEELPCFLYLIQIFGTADAYLLMYLPNLRVCLIGT